MEKSKLVKILLIVSGTIGTGIGMALLFAPVAFEASAGITLEENVNLLSEIRAPGGALLVIGGVILLGAFNSKVTYMSLVLSSMIYLSYGLSRVLSMGLDGMPNESLITATIIEIIIGLLSLFILYRIKQETNEKVKTLNYECK